MKGYSQLIVGLLALGFASVQPAVAHLCNDVFAQAQDNLAVKVDIRDGQLRIGQEASFRVYLLNTMDRGIATIGLEVVAPEFDSKVEPDPEWNGFPALKEVKNGGKKQYFTVTLTRKAGVPDGKYKIDLRLFNPNNKSQEFKTVDIGNACSSHTMKPASGITVNGTATQTEWQQAVLCTDFYAYKKQGSYFTNQRADDQSRIRVAADKDSLFCLLGLEGRADADEDIAAIYAASTPDDEPRVVRIDRVTGKVTVDGDASSIVVKKSDDGKQLECRIPRSILGIADAKSFLVNFTRTTRKNGREDTDFWRGNPMSLQNPVVYDRFVVD